MLRKFNYVNKMLKELESSPAPLTTQGLCQHLSAVVDWQICSCFTLQIQPNQLCGGGDTNSFLFVEFFPTPTPFSTKSKSILSTFPD